MYGAGGYKAAPRFFEFRYIVQCARRVTERGPDMAIAMLNGAGLTL